ncbi:hypothetical protein [Halomonas binhaiensis]|uniref:Uncharacterized protein n=1 Tax=Halomonas binhaiensis TaxID=2562282 RepID=A0A5C1NG33_9GAMM|nr:hypothetical protein [Halomonas binhaiensis]QEM82124.1 hypothetical protein E4T21_11620 [Halomonas binhaiensis]
MSGNHVLILSGLLVFAILLGLRAFISAKKSASFAEMSEFTTLREKIRSALRAEVGKKELSEIDDYIGKNYTDSSREGRKEILDQLIFRFVVSKGARLASLDASRLKQQYVAIMSNLQSGNSARDTWIEYCRTFVQKTFFPKLKKVIVEGELSEVVEKESMSWMYNPSNDFAEGLWIRLLNDLVVEDLDADISDFLETRGDV